MTKETSNRTAEYKGKKYRLLFLGNTKHGRRAHLQFFSGDKNFWVDARLVTESSNPVPSSNSKNRRNGRRYECDECGEWVGEGDGSRCWETGCAH